MRISCVIPAYNVERYLRRAVESLFATAWPDLEVLIVDDASTDGTWAVAQALASERRDIICLRHPDGGNHGCAASRNVGIRSATGEMFCLLDGDDYVYPWRFDAALEILRTRPEVDAVYGTSEMVFEDAAAEAAWWGPSKIFGVPAPVPPNELLFALLRDRCCWATSTILFRRELLDRTGLFDAGLIAEDCHLWFRMASVGTLVADRLERPVSAYFRRCGSKYTATLAERVHMNRAMISFYEWMAARNPRDERLPRVREYLREYILQGIESARQGRDRRLAWTLAAAAGRFPYVLAERRYYGHLRRMVVGR